VSSQLFTTFQLRWFWIKRAFAINFRFHDTAAPDNGHVAEVLHFQCEAQAESAFRCFMIVSLILNFCTFPVTVMGNSSTIWMYFGILK
jgi:hypothetical protein